MAEAKVSKASVDYGPGHPNSRCGLCEYFVSRDKRCRKVMGEIHPGDWCKLFKHK